MKISVYEPNSRHLREVLIFCFNMKKSAAEAHRMLSNTYGEVAISEKTCREWFQRFKNGDFDVEDGIAVEERRFSKMQNWRHYLSKTRVKIKNNWHDHWEWLNKPFQNAMGMIQKQENWVPYELKPRDVERHLFACEQLLERQRRKGFLHRIVTGDEKWIHYDNPKRRKSWGVPGHASTSTAKPNIYGSKVMLCIWWDQLGVVYYELLKPTEIITGDRYRTQLMRLSNWAEHWKTNGRNTTRDTIKWFCSMNARSHVAKVTRHTWKRWNGKSYPTRRILQTLLPLIITCFDQWHTTWLTSTSGLMKK